MQGGAGAPRGLLGNGQSQCVGGGGVGGNNERENLYVRGAGRVPGQSVFNYHFIRAFCVGKNCVTVTENQLHQQKMCPRDRFNGSRGGLATPFLLRKLSRGLLTRHSQGETNENDDKHKSNSVKRRVRQIN